MEDDILAIRVNVEASRADRLVLLVVLAARGNHHASPLERPRHRVGVGVLGVVLAVGVAVRAVEEEELALL